MSLRVVFIFFFYSILLVCPTYIHAQASVKESEQLEFAQGLLSRGMYDMAILQYQKFITDYPKSPSLQEAYLSLGEGYFLSQEFDKATDAFNQFNQLFPNSDQLPMSILRLGQIDIQEKKFDDALKELTSVNIEKQLKDKMLQSFYFYIGQAFLGKSDNASALAFFQKATQVPGASDYSANAFEEIGKIQVSGGHYSDAMDAYTKSTQLAGDDALKGELVYRIAEVNFLSGKYTDAIKGFSQILDQTPGSDFKQDALANLLLTYFNLGQYDKLLDEYQKNAQEIKDDDIYFATHYAAVQAYIELKKYDQANALSDRILAFPSLKSQERAKVFIKKADILIREKKYKDGLALLQAYSSENADEADENYFLEAQANFGLGDFDQAFKFYGNVTLNFPDSRFYKASLLGQAHSSQEAGRFKESETLFLKSAEQQDQPDMKRESLYDAVLMAVKAGDLSGVISNAQEYLKDFPTGDQYSNVLFTLVDSYSKNNQSQEAINLLQGYLAKPQTVQSPNTAYFLLGFNQQLLGKSDLALDAYAQVDQHKEDGKLYVAALKNMAIIFLTQNKQAQAKIYFDRMISQGKQGDLQLQTYVWVCNEYLKEQKYDDVLRVAARAEKNFSAGDLMEIKYFKAEALRGLDSCDEAIKNYGIVTSSAQKNAYTGSSHIGYGLCLENTKKFDGARGEFQKALDENADDYTIAMHAQFEIANLDVSQGNLDEALKYYILVATIYDDQFYSSESLLRAGQILERQKHKDDAVKMYAEILDKYKNSAAAEYAKQRVGFLK